jgi:hypothetical protein
MTTSRFRAGQAAFCGVPPTPRGNPVRPDGTRAVL